MDLSSFRCPECDYTVTKLDSLRIHAQQRHSLPTRKLYAHLFLPDGQEPTCACGCGEPTKFITLQKGFCEYVRGHASRVHNNWGHNEAARAKSLQKRRDEGLWSKNPWNRGKNKESDSEFAKIVEKAYNTETEKFRRSELMKCQWKDGIIHSLTGSSHPMWHGGTSALQPLVRSHIFNSWAYPKLKAAGFKCSACSATDELEVHHDGERFAVILYKAIQHLGEPGDSFEKKSLIAEWVSDYHSTHSVSGRVLCSSCHDAEHSRHLSLSP
jgi:hypothetical protein